ncbi:MAG: ATP-dependent DNA helicase [Phenylobacterium sp.]|uniref:ATP-dependent DNA helicase n=1 Tax=Phenylobacterium sp. TaxID=1871053 RepID=UPI00301AE1FC
MNLPPALVVLPGPKAALAGEGPARLLRPPEARDLFRSPEVLVAHAALTARRLGLDPPPRSARMFDVLELFAFVRPGAFTAPSAAGLALALGRPEPSGPLEMAEALSQVAVRLLEELAESPTPSREEALALAETLARGGWAWGPATTEALRSRPSSNAFRSSGLDVWSRLVEWEDPGPAGEPGDTPISPEAAVRRLGVLLGRARLEEDRTAQAEYAREAAFVFEPREREGSPRMLLAEAGTGVGKTLGYLAPASAWAEVNGPSVWISTYTRALQRQIERESAVLFPDPAERARRAVVRKGRENYLCLLNFQDLSNTAQLGSADLVGLGLTARWIRATRDGDMTGGDFPAWLPGLFAGPAAGQATASNLVDRRGECIHAGCPHYRTCFVEKAIRASRRADIVIANHALVMAQAAFDGARSVRGAPEDSESTHLRRVIFDEGHHLFDAADSAFSTALSGQEAVELRRWIRGAERRGRRGRGLEARVGDLAGADGPARQALESVIQAAGQLPSEGWSSRISGADGVGAQGPLEGFLAAMGVQLRARGDPADPACAARPALPEVVATARSAAAALAAIEAPLLALTRSLEDLLDQGAETLTGAERGRIEGVLRGLDRRARMTLPAWRGMLATLDGEPEPEGGEGSAASDFVDWFEATVIGGRAVDSAFRRHWVDPTEPLARLVLEPAHGVLITSATLTDAAAEDPFDLAELRSGGGRLETPPRRLRLASPFDYVTCARAFVVTDVRKDDARQVAAAMRELFLAAGGGGLGLFTAIRRLRAVHELIAAPLGDRGLSLYAQHVDPLEVGALVDIFRAEVDSCLLGTDAVRDGVDVPGRSLRLLVFDRAPWPRPDLLHKARRARFGNGWDDAIARGRIAQAFGRLIRRQDDKGVFVMLDSATPTRLFAALPPGAEVRRVTLVEALEATRAFLGPG